MQLQFYYSKIMVPDYFPLTLSIHGHTVITTITGKGEEKKEEIYLIGGLNVPTHFRGSSTIYKLMNGADNKTEFRNIATTLNYGRAYHIALPISYKFAKESCQGHLIPKKVSNLNEYEYQNHTILNDL